MTTAQNKTIKSAITYAEKDLARTFEEENDIKQGEKQLENKDRVINSAYNKFLINASKLTESEYNDLDSNVQDLCVGYEEIIEAVEYL